jgi:hypothetical protein
MMKTGTVERVGWRARAWAEATGLGMTSVWALLSNREIKSLKIGNLVLITTSPREWIERMEEEQRANGAPLPPIPPYKKTETANQEPVKNRRPGRPRKYPKFTE